MPCSKYKSKRQRGLCYATKGWKDWSKIRGIKKMKLQFRERNQKRYYDFSSRVLQGMQDAKKMKKMAEKDFPLRKFRIKKR